MTGTPTLLASPTLYNFTVTTPGSQCASDTATARIQVNSASSLALVSGNPVMNQCGDTAIAPIEFLIGGGGEFGSLTFTPITPGAPATTGMTASYNNVTGQLLVSGNLISNVTSSPYVYSYTINTINNPNGCDEASFTSSITILPNDTITLLPGSAPLDQQVCVQSDISTVTLQLGGGAISYTITWTGGNPGIFDSFNPTTKVISLTGFAGIAVSSPTIYPYAITTTGICSSVTISGSIEIVPLSTMNLISPTLRLDQQTGNAAICLNDPIQDIQYQLGGGAINARLTFTTLTPGQQLGIGLVGPDANNIVTISTISIPNFTISQTTVFPYEIETVNANGCAPEIVAVGNIQMHPIPTVNETVILNEDVTNISCNGANDGSIIIPTSPISEFQRRISGGQLAEAQVDRVYWSGATPTLLEVVSVAINGTSFNHTVVEDIPGSGVSESINTIFQDLVDQINRSGLDVQATLLLDTGFVPAQDYIRIESLTAGLSFTAQGTNTTSGAASTTIVNVTANRAANYQFTWTGNVVINGISSTIVRSGLSQTNLPPGEYYLSVSINGCNSNPQLTPVVITEPDAITVTVTTCEESAKVDIIGGTAPYTVRLLRETLNASNQLVNIPVETRPNIYSPGTTFSALTPGGNYIAQIFDANSANSTNTFSGCYEEVAFRVTSGISVNVAAIEALIQADICNEQPVNIPGGSISALSTIPSSTVWITGGSGDFDYEWLDDNNRIVNSEAFTNPTENLYPGTYVLVITDNLLGCDYRETFILSGEPDITIEASAATNPLPIPWFPANPSIPSITSSTTTSTTTTSTTSTATVIDSLVELQCVGDRATLGVDILTTSLRGYNITWTNLLTGSPAGSGATLSDVEEGIYEARINFGGSCDYYYRFEVREPAPIGIREVSEARVESLCVGSIGSTIQFELTGPNAARAQEVVLNNALSERPVANNGRYFVTFSNLDETTIGIVNANAGTNSGTIRLDYEIAYDALCDPFEGAIEINRLFLPQQIDFNAVVFRPIDCSNNDYPFGVIEISADPILTGEDLTSALIVWEGDVDDPDLPGYRETEFSAYLPWNIDPTDYGMSSQERDAVGLPLIFGGDNTYLFNIQYPGEYRYTIYSGTGSATCPLGSGTIVIEDNSSISQLQITSLDVTQPGCGSTLGEIEIELDDDTIVPPLDIVWERFSTTTAITTGTQVVNVVINGVVSQTTVSQTVQVQQWQSLPQYRGQAQLRNVPNGVYRATLSDGRGTDNSCATGNITTRNITISSEGINITNFEVEDVPFTGTDANDCSQSVLSDVTFNVNSNITNARSAFIINLTHDGNTIFNDEAVENGGNERTSPGHFVSASEVVMSRRGSFFRVNNLEPGEYTLTVGQLSTTSSDTVCEQIYIFNVAEYEPITWTGDTEINISPCDNQALVTAQVQGGRPFILPNGEVLYQYEWTFRPYNAEGVFDGTIQEFFSETIILNRPGQLSLTVIDSRCSFDLTESISFEVDYEYPPFTVSPELIDPATGDRVFSMPPSCGDDANDGQIFLSVDGGRPPYVINWYKENPLPEFNDPNAEFPGFEPLPAYRGSTRLTDLQAGNYRINIVSLNNECSNNNIQGNNAFNFTQDIVVQPNRDLYILDGPYVDEDLCRQLPGRLIIDVYDNLQGALTFTYNGELVLTDDINRISDRTYTLLIAEPQANAELIISNAEGCRISTSISLGVGDPNFTYSSINYESVGTILAREEVTFENTSTDPFIESQWLFGDNTPSVRVPVLRDSIIPVRHAYGISGTYFATLRISNEIGCTEETTQPIIVGKGYNILVPNVFTPNNDLVNDTFKPLFSGFRSMQFTIYDYRGNVVYTENQEVETDSNYEPLQIQGWDAENVADSPYYVYTAVGTTLFGDVIVERSGTFIVIQ